MRVTNKMLSNNFLRDMNTNLNSLSKLQNQMASGKQINKASDDPVKAAKIMQMNSDINANKQYNSNIKSTTNWLDVTDGALDKVGTVITRIDELLLSSGNANDASSQAAIKDEINQRVEELAGYLNTSFDGKYIFGGTSGASKPVGTTTTDGNIDLISNLKPKILTKTVDNGVNYTYEGAAVVTGSKFNMFINGESTEVTITAAIVAGNTMESIASTLQTNINTANTTANAVVTVAADGTFEITPAGTITFSDTKATQDLGLSVAVKDQLFVEVSQGVTMGYNVTASQVIGYGEGHNNLMKLLTNITSHLSSTDAGDIKKLANEDLAGIKKAMANVLKLRSEVGAKQNRMESAEARNTDQNLNMTEIRSSIEDIDITEKAMEYATMQTIYLASLQTSAKVLQPTLLDYL